MSKYKEQFERVGRWHSLFQEIDSGTAHDRNSEYSQDIVYAFFINCYHLKDWIIHDDTIKITDKKNKIEQFITNNRCLSDCADICNGVKHLELDLSRSRTGKQPEFKGRNHAIELGPKGTIYSCKYNIITSTGNKDAFELATECVQKWEEFIKKEIK